MITIETRYAGPSNRLGARIIATAGSHRLMIPHPYELNQEAAHRSAAVALAGELGWPTPNVAIATKAGYAFAFMPGLLTQQEFNGVDMQAAERIAGKLGYIQATYTSGSALWGLFCLPDRPTQRRGCIIKTAELGLMFVQNEEDLLITN